MFFFFVFFFFAFFCTLLQKKTQNKKGNTAGGLEFCLMIFFGFVGCSNATFVLGYTLALDLSPSQSLNSTVILLVIIFSEIGRSVGMFIAPFLYFFENLKMLLVFIFSTLCFCLPLCFAFVLYLRYNKSKT